MGFDSGAFDYLLEKLDPIGVCKFGLMMVIDIIDVFEERCPKMAIDICDQTIRSFTDIKRGIEERRAEQLRDCKDTGKCSSHYEMEQQIAEDEAVKASTRRIFAVGPGGEVQEVNLDDVIRENPEIEHAGNVPVNEDGTIDRDSLPEEMPEELKDKLVEELPKIAQSITSTIESLRECETEEERQAILELLRADMQVKH